MVGGLSQFCIPMACCPHKISLYTKRNNDEGFKSQLHANASSEPPSASFSSSLRLAARIISSRLLCSTCCLWSLLAAQPDGRLSSFSLPLSLVLIRDCRLYLDIRSCSGFIGFGPEEAVVMEVVGGAGTIG